MYYVSILEGDDGSVEGDDGSVSPDSQDILKDWLYN